MSLNQEEKDHRLALEIQRNENEVARNTILKDAEKAAILRCGRSDAAVHYLSSKNKGHMDTGGYGHNEESPGSEAIKIYNREQELREESAHRATRSGHGYL